MAVEGAGVVPAKAAPLVRAAMAMAETAAAVRKVFMSMSFV